MKNSKMKSKAVLSWSIALTGLVVFLAHAGYPVHRPPRAVPAAAAEGNYKIQLIFPGHLIREYHAYAPFYRDCQSPRDYRLEAWVEGQWTQLLEVRADYQRLRKHVLSPRVNTNRLRVAVATNGDPSAALYEIRCYA
jgi:hypothetical protein